MLPHWCQDETNALLAVLGFAAPAVIWVKAKWRALKDFMLRRFEKQPVELCKCGHEHAESPGMEPPKA